MTRACEGKPHPRAIQGLQLFNERKFFEAHEALEDAWREETEAVRDLYRGVLQVAVVYLHVTRANYAGAVKVHHRSLKWLKDWPAICRGIHVEELRNDLQDVMREVQFLGRDGLGAFDPSAFKPVKWEKRRIWICDRCGTEMHEKNCKVSCPNCGNRFDCSDLSIYFD